MIDFLLKALTAVLYFMMLAAPVLLVIYFVTALVHDLRQKNNNR